MEMNSAAAHLWRPIQILGFDNPVIMHYWVDRTLIKHIFGYRTRIIQKLHVAWYELTSLLFNINRGIKLIKPPQVYEVIVSI